LNSGSETARNQSKSRSTGPTGTGRLDE